jgi:Lipid A 3-O-deacylase (PagL)
MEETIQHCSDNSMIIVTLKLLQQSLFFFCIAISLQLYAQKDSASFNKPPFQFPQLLKHASFGVDIGLFQYAFSAAQLEPGYKVKSVKIPPLGIRVNLLSYNFNKHFAANIYYMRPVLFVEYNNINNDGKRYLVTPNIGAFTVRGNIPITTKLQLHAETGLSIVTRSGININDEPVLKEASYASMFFESGFTYKLNNKWRLQTSMSYVPGNKKEKHPYTAFYSAGFRYHMQPLAADKLIEKQKAGYYFPKQVLQIGITNNAFGYGVNDFFSGKTINPVPVFWGGGARVQKGISINYLQTAYHGRKFFSLEWGISAGYWQTEELKEQFFTIAAYPVFKFHVLRLKNADGYFYYSVAGPAFQSKTNLDFEPLGKKFTFRDYMGIGTYTGKHKRLNLELNIGHFSNGNLFPFNAGIMVPLSLYAGYCF